MGLMKMPKNQFFHKKSYTDVKIHRMKLIHPNFHYYSNSRVTYLFLEHKWSHEKKQTLQPNVTFEFRLSLYMKKKTRFQIFGKKM